MTGAGAPEHRAAADAALSGHPGEGSPEDAEAAVRDLLVESERRHAFGPVFFLTHLRAFVREHCPDPAEGLPAVELALVDGTRLRLCHVIGVAPAWVALAVFDENSAGERMMRTEFVPYASIARIGIRPPRGEGPDIGFLQSGPPAILGERSAGSAVAEQVLRTAAGVPAGDAPPGPVHLCHETRSPARRADES